MGQHWRHLTLLIVTALLLVGLYPPVSAATTNAADNIAALIDPAKLATLGKRGANPRIQKAVYWLATAKANGEMPQAVLDVAVLQADYTNAAAAKLTKDALLRNLDIARKLGCLDEEGMGEMRRGNAATVKTGPYKGDQLSVDHIIPRAVVPELDNVIANLELMPQRANSKKGDKVGSRQVSYAEKLHAAGLLSEDGLKAVRAAGART